MRKTYPFPIAVLVLFIRLVEIDAIQSADCQRQDELNESEDRVRDVANAHFDAVEDAHLVLLLCCRRIRVGYAMRCDLMNGISPPLPRRTWYYRTCTWRISIWQISVLILYTLYVL